MVPISRLTSTHKLDPKSLAKAFDAETLEERPKVKKLVEAMRDTIRDGIYRNRKDYRLYKAMDWAYDSPFYQVSYTQLRGLLSEKPDDRKVMQTVQNWGLAHLLPDVIENGKPCCNADGTVKKAVNLPVFFNVFVPIVMAYITIRWAKLFNDRNLIPLYKYEPVQFTKENRLRCEVVTQVVQRQATWFDYKSDLRQSILQSLLYGFCINFPREAWFVEKQEDESGTESIVREGLRFNMPHPSRVYYDLYHRLSSLNSNSGCEYAGYWELCRYKDIHDHPLYWNKEKISIGAVSWFDIGRSDFLEQVYPCNMTFPSLSDANGSGGTGALDRESEAVRCYGQGDFNSATLMTQHFQRIIPKDFGLGGYEYPVWFRFVFASDNAVIWAEPLAYDRLPTYTYDADFNRARFRSLALEIMPFQDHIGNLLTQWILAVKENLVNPVFYDKEKIPAEYLRLLENVGQKFINGRLFIPFSSTEQYRFKTDQREAFYVPTFSRHETGQLATLIAGVLNMLDRTMQLSPQEIGQTASHEQTAEENRIIERNTSTRVTFTGGFIDDGDYAKKVILYDGLMAYADDNITVGISSAFANTKEEFDKLIKEVGLTIDDKSDYDPMNPDGMHKVKAKKSALHIEAFASVREAAARIDNPAIADAMSKIFTAIANNPVLIQSVGAIQLVELLNQIIVVAGLPKDFKLRGTKIDTEASQEEQNNQMQELLTQFSAQVKQAIDESQKTTLQAAAEQTQQLVGQAVGEVGQQISPLAEGVAQANQVNQLQQKQLEDLAGLLAELNMKIQAAMPPPPPPPPPPFGPPMAPPLPPPPIAPMVQPAVPVGVPA